LGFQVDARDSFVVCPLNAAPGKPWVWRAEFFGAFDFADRALLAEGWHLAYHRVSDLYGCPRAIQWMDAFYRAVTQELSLSRLPVLFGFSRGGLYACNYALAHPNQVLALYLDAPVLDIRSWPGGQGASDAQDPDLWQQCLDAYGLDAQTAQTFRGSPLDNADRLAQASVPILLVAGLADSAVPYAENGAPFRDRFTAAGGDLHVIEKPNCGHHPHSLENPEPIVSWVLGQWTRHRPNTLTII
jgi:pimeloyl-ACP methyl ester carboxylesterase